MDILLSSTTGSDCFATKNKLDYMLKFECQDKFIVKITVVIR